MPYIFEKFSPGGSSGGIIDVTELPTENINEGALYRLMTGAFVYNQNTQETVTVHCVETLPGTGLPATDVDNSQGNVYYCISDGEAYGYVDSTLSAAMSVPVGWYDGATLVGAMGYAYNGTITDIADDPCDDSFRLLLTYEYYTYKGEWTKIVFAYEKAPKFDIQWDGVIGDRFALDLTSLGFENTYYVKVSNEVFTVEQLNEAKVTLSDGSEFALTSSDIDAVTYPGGLDVGNGVMVVYSQEDLNTALGLPAGYVTNGTYFIFTLYEEGNIYTNRLVAPPRITKIDKKYLGLEDITEELFGLQQRVSSLPDVIYTDVVRTCSNQSLSSTDKYNARNNIDVYSKSEVETMIASAIGSAIGGSY